MTSYDCFRPLRHHTYEGSTLRKASHGHSQLQFSTTAGRRLLSDQVVIGFLTLQLILLDPYKGLIPMASQMPILLCISAQIGQLFQIFGTLGTPDERSWKGVTSLPDWQPHFPKWPPKSLHEVNQLSDWLITRLSRLFAPFILMSISRCWSTRELQSELIMKTAWDLFWAIAQQDLRCSLLGSEGWSHAGE